MYFTIITLMKESFQSNGQHHIQNQGQEKAKYGEKIALNTLPNKFLTEQHLSFFHKYGFVVIRGLHTPEMNKKAKQGAQFLIQNAEKDISENLHVFAHLPEGIRNKWARCQEPRLMGFFDYQENKDLVQSLIGKFQFKHHDGPGYYTFAPRFHQWSKHPKAIKADQSKTQPPYDPLNIPKDVSAMGIEFIKKCHNIGIQIGKPTDTNWHLDGQDLNHVMTFPLLWGSYISAARETRMGNLHVYPGSHHVMADILKKQGPIYTFNAAKGEKQPPRPNLKRQSVCDGKAYSVCVEEGDVLLAHPWLAHGIGINESSETRLAVYCRVQSDTFWRGGRDQVAGKKLNGFQMPKKWTGDYWANTPGLRDWLKANKTKLNYYDNGELKKGLQKL